MNKSQMCATLDKIHPHLVGRAAALLCEVRGLESEMHNDMYRMAMLTCAHACQCSYSKRLDGSQAAVNTSAFAPKNGERIVN